MKSVRKLSLLLSLGAGGCAYEDAAPDEAAPQLFNAAEQTLTVDLSGIAGASGGSPIKTCAVENEKSATWDFTTGQALGRNFDLIQARVDQLNTNLLNGIKDGDPNAKVMAYVNGAFSQAGEGPSNPPYAGAVYVRNYDNTYYLRSNFNNWLMDINQPSWRNHVAANCNAEAGINGCWLDVLGHGAIGPFNLVAATAAGAEFPEANDTPKLWALDANTADNLDWYLSARGELTAVNSQVGSRFMGANGIQT